MVQGNNRRCLRCGLVCAEGGLLCSSTRCVGHRCLRCSCVWAQVWAPLQPVEVCRPQLFEVPQCAGSTLSVAYFAAVGGAWATVVLRCGFHWRGMDQHFEACRPGERLKPGACDESMAR